jgi:hypothetical protein
MSEQQIQKIWKSVESSIKQETIRSLPFVYVVKENFIKSKHWLCSRKLSGWLRDAKIATPDTPCLFIFSIKMITAMLIHMLDERGDLNLLDPISYYIPEYGVNGKRRATIFICFSSWWHSSH